MGSVYTTIFDVESVCVEQCNPVVARDGSMIHTHEIKIKQANGSYVIVTLHHGQTLDVEVKDASK